MLVTLVTAEKNCFQESFKANEPVRISKFIWQRVPDYQASVIKSPTAVRAKSAARNSETNRFFRSNLISNRIGQWRQREFKVGGDEAPKGMSPFPPDPAEGSGRGNFFVISKWHILVTLRC